MTARSRAAIDPRTPVLVGAGQITDMTGAPSSERSRVAFAADAARLALTDAQATIGREALAREIDTLAVLEFFDEQPTLRVALWPLDQPAQERG